MYHAAIAHPLLGSGGSARPGLAHLRLLGVLAALLVVLPACVLPPDPYPPPVAVRIIRVHTFDPAAWPFDNPSFYVVRRIDTGEQWEIGGAPEGRVGDVYRIRQWQNDARGVPPRSLSRGVIHPIGLIGAGSRLGRPCRLRRRNFELPVVDGVRHLRYFLAVADTLNFSRAAERLRVAQPALSRQIHDLEEELGFRLFERSTVKVNLTEPGRFFQQQAAKLLMQLDIAVTSAQRTARGTTGEFRIGMGWRASELFITDAAREFHEQHPGLSIDFVELIDHQQTQAIRERKIDVGFVSRNRLTPRKDLGCRLIYTCAVKAILPARTPGQPGRGSLARPETGALDRAGRGGGPGF